MGSERLIGAIVAGRFKIEALLGEGGMGTVYLARHTVLQRTFALKLMRQKLASNETMAARFRREARAASRVQHPNVTAVFDFGVTEDGRPYMVQEYVRGESLARVIRREPPMSVPRALHVLRQIADGLEAAHACRVIHRDLKPENVLLTLRGNDPDFVKLHDFGLAKIMEASPTATASNISADGLVFGTPEYLSPEQCMGQPADERSDIYSYGVLAYELLTGHPPFEGQIINVIDGHVREQPAKPARASGRADIPPALESLVLRCLFKPPEQRFVDAAELLMALEEVELGVRREATVPDARATSAALEATLPIPRSGLTAEKLGWRPTPGLPPVQPRRSFALDELACAARDRRLGGTEITEALAEKARADDRRLALRAKLVSAGRRQEELEQVQRQREGSLRFALAQLEHERERGAGGAGVDRAREEVGEALLAVARESEEELTRLEHDTEELREAMQQEQTAWEATERRLEGLIRGVRGDLAGSGDDELLTLLDEAGLKP